MAYPTRHHACAFEFLCKLSNLFDMLHIWSEDAIRLSREAFEKVCAPLYRRVKDGGQASGSRHNRLSEMRSGGVPEYGRGPSGGHQPAIDRCLGSLRRETRREQFGCNQIFDGLANSILSGSSAIVRKRAFYYCA